MSAYFSPSGLYFIPEQWKLDGTYSDNNWPKDAILLTGEESSEYWKSSPPYGKCLSCTPSGRPCWVDIPPPSHDEMVALAEDKKSHLIADAEQLISPLERAKQLGIATDEELSKLVDLERYSVFLMRVDTSLAPGIEWPQKPQ